MRPMWISRKKWKVLEKRVADLERQLQDQPRNEEISYLISYRDADNLVKEQNNERHIYDGAVCS